MLTPASYWSSDVILREVDYSTWLNNGWSQTTLAWTLQIAGSKPCSNDASTNVCTASDTITAAAIYINTAQAPGLFSGDKRQALVAHELGHAFSIAHNSVIGQDSLMKNGAWNDSRFSYTPTNPDIADVNSMYHP